MPRPRDAWQFLRARGRTTRQWARSGRARPGLAAQLFLPALTSYMYAMRSQAMAYLATASTGIRKVTVTIKCQ